MKSEQWKEYRYYAEYSEALGTLVYRPMIEVTVCFSSSEHRMLVLLDSGSDSTLIDDEVSDVLGIDSEKYPKGKVSGIAEMSANAYIAPITMKVEGFVEEFPFNVRFVNKLAISGILGHSDFFSLFQVKFDLRNKKFYLLKN